MAALVSASKLPNILITGTPGVGKSTTAQLMINSMPNFKLLEVSAIAKENNFGEHDLEFDTLILDDDGEDALLDMLEPLLEKGGCIVDFHSPELFPESWFELILVLRSNTEILYDRLTARGYNEKKRNENMECEIMQVILEEARESYDQNIVHEVQSNTIEDMESNVERVSGWYKAWAESH
jgi:adenylate kinase